MIILINKIKKLLKGSAWKLVQNVPRIKKQNKTVIMWDSRDFMRAVFKFMKKLHWSIPHKLHCEIWQNYPPNLYLYLYMFVLRVGFSSEHTVQCHTWWIFNLFWRNFTEVAHTKCIVKYDKTTPPIYIYTSLSWEFLVNIL